MARSFLIHALLLSAASRLGAQQSRAPGGPQIQLGAQAVGLLTHMSPAVDGQGLTEGYLTQPVIMVHAGAFDGAFTLRGMLNFEGVTLQRGELNAGIWGESYVDRRHPHTYLHELMGTLGHDFDAGSVTLSAGKGFAPFGTDDPMVRGLVKFPVNHHLAQILERLTGILAIRYRCAVIEAGIFNGDEPLGPGSNGTLDRFGDSWSLRGTVAPIEGVELQASRAEVESPELREGGGLDQRKTSVSGRMLRAVGGMRVYALGEYARTGYVNRGVERLRFSSYLGEISAQRSSWRIAGRYENTVRPEEERVVDGYPFRTVRPPTDFSILGRTRWRITTLQLSRDQPYKYGSIRPFLEVERADAETVNKPAVYEPDQFYGDHVLWTLSLGIRLTAGTQHVRMGRYGAADLSRSETHHMRH